MNEVISKPSLLRKYIYEYVLICLSVAVIYLFHEQRDLNNYIRKEHNQTLNRVSENLEKLNTIFLTIKK